MSTPTLTPETPMGTIMETLPGARRALFARYHLGGCQSCGFSPDESLASLCARSGDLPVSEVIEHLLSSHVHDEAMLISPAEAKTRLDSPAPPMLVDARTREEFDAVRIPDSRFLNQELQQTLFGGNPDLVILIYDHAGRNVLDSVAWFRGHGRKQTYGIRGGIDAWSREIDPSLPRYRIEIDS